jgi:DNA-binding MarR family transcriptional regulator
MRDSIENLFHASEKMNGDTMSLVRCLILTMLFHYRDGLQFRELKTVFQVSDGKLVHNLEKLIEFQYVKKDQIEYDNKKLTLYTLTSEGRKEVEKLGEWMESVLKIISKE